MTFKELKPLIEQWFIDRDLHTKESGRQLIKLEEEMLELKQAYTHKNRAEVIDAIGDITVVSKFIVKIVLGFIIDAQFSFAKHAFVHFIQYFGCLEIHASGCKLMGNENHTISFAVFVAGIMGNINAPFNVCNGRVVYERAVFFE